MQLQLANFIRGRLAANITAAATSIPLTAAAFPALAGGAVCYAVLQSATDRAVVEIVKVTVGGATLTVERAQEGTTAKAFSANDIIEQRLTAGQFQSVVDHSNAANSHVPAGVTGKFLKGVQDGAPVWGMPTAQDVGALPITGGTLTGPLGVQTINGLGSSGTWGSVDITGTKGGYAGINFPSVGRWFGIRPDGLSGVWDSAGTSKWYFDENGWLGGGAIVPWNIIADHPSRANWASKADVVSMVTGQLAWRFYGNGHSIFDASAGLSPDGAAVDKNNAQIAWRPDNAAYPSLMGWNGVNTYGLRVDSSRRADGAGWADGAAYANKLDGDIVTTIGRDLRFYGKRAMVGKDNNDGNQLVINYDNDFSSTAIQGDLYAGVVQSSRHVIIHNGATNYATAGLDVRSTDGSEVRIAMHRAGHSAGAIVHNSWGFTFERETAGSTANVAAGSFFANDAQSGLGNALTRLDYVGANFLKYRTRIHPDDGMSLDNVSREYGFNYGTGGGSVGPYISFGGLGGSYDCQITAAYVGNGSEIKFRTRNGDAGVFNPWHSFWNTGNFDPNTKLNAAGGTITGQVYSAVNGVPNTFVGGKISSESGTLSLDAYTHAFVTSPLDVHLCFNSRFQPSVGWVKYDNNSPSGKVVVNHGGLQYVRSDSGSSDANQYTYSIWHGGNLNPIEKNVGNVLNNPGFGVGFLSSSDASSAWIAAYFGKNGGLAQVVAGENNGMAVIGAHNAAKNAWAPLLIGMVPNGIGNEITYISRPYAVPAGSNVAQEIFHRGMFNPDEERRFVARGDAADCNTAVANGHWRLTPSTPNTPVANYGHMFTVSEGFGAGNGGAWLQQTAYMHDGTIWTRRSVNGGWAGWTRLWDSAGFNPDSKLSNNGSGGTLHLSDWFRSIGPTGWYNETFEGGIYMDEPTTIKIHNGKKFYTANTEHNAISATGGIFSSQRMMVDTQQQFGDGSSFQSCRYISAPFHAEHGGLNPNTFAPMVGSSNHTNGPGYTTRIHLGVLSAAGPDWSKAALLVGSAENDAHAMAVYTFDAYGSVTGISNISVGANATIGNDMSCNHAYANGAQPQVPNALTRKDYVDAGDYATRWNNSQVIQHGGGDANAHYNSAWDGANVANAPIADWCFFRELHHSGGSNWRHQEAFEFFSDEEWFRRGMAASDYGPWRRRWHSGNFDPASKADLSGATFTGNINAPTFNGLALNYSSAASTVAVRDSNGDLAVRLLRPDYGNQSDMYGAIAFRGAAAGDNYLRFCDNPAAVRNWMGAAASAHTHAVADVAGVNTVVFSGSTINGVSLTATGAGVYAIEGRSANDAAKGFTGMLVWDGVSESVSTQVPIPEISSFRVSTAGLLRVTGSSSAPITKVVKLM